MFDSIAAEEQAYKDRPTWIPHLHSIFHVDRTRRLLGKDRSWDFRTSSDDLQELLATIQGRLGITLTLIINTADQPAWETSTGTEVPIPVDNLFDPLDADHSILIASYPGKESIKCRVERGCPFNLMVNALWYEIVRPGEGLYLMTDDDLS